MPHSPGQVLNNRYKIISLLGQGGMGAVYCGWDNVLQRSCAIKENLDPRSAAEKQFQREVKILAGLNHPNLPVVTDYFVIPGKGQYLVMEYVEGQDLQEKLNKSNGPLSEAQVTPWIIQICEALEYLHGQNPPVIHRDIKPANIKITVNGRIKLVDFGIAKLYEPNIKTTQGAKAVTSGYSPPEQYGRGVTDQQSDIYSLGATLYHLLTGRLPPDSIDLMSGESRPLTPASTVNPSISPAVSNVIEHAMQLRRDSRFRSAFEFKNAIAFRGETVFVADKKKRQAGYLERIRNSIGTLKVRQLAGFFAVLLLIGFILSLGIQIVGKPDSRSATQTALSQVFVIETGSSVGSIILDTPGIETQRQDISTAVDNQESLTQTSSFQQTENVLATTSLEVTIDASESERAASLTPTENQISQNWVVISAGEFQMGSEEIDQQASNDEKPQHIIFLDNYTIDKYEVTNQQFAEFLNARGNQNEGGASWLDEGDPDNRIHRSGNLWIPDEEYKTHPVIEVTWYGAQAYCTWRRAKLPTEAQWEKAARGTDTRIYPWGNDFDCHKGNFDDETSDDPDVVLGGVNCDGFNRTSPVGSFPAGVSPFGVFDMVGNVWEWVLDWYQDAFYSSTPSQNPMGPESGTSRVIRGGSWGFDEKGVRVTFRLHSSPNNTMNDLGFRCASLP